MALLNSENIPLGSPAADFSLPSVDGRHYELKDFAGAPALVLMFICAHCPYVKAIEDRLLDLSREYMPLGVVFVGICSNDPTDYPEDKAENLLKLWKEKDYRFPYLIDETQEVAKAYQAVCTPDLYVYDSQQQLAYHGRLDDDWKEANRVKRQDLKAALDALLNGKKPAQEQISSMGCSIKWKK